MTRRREILFSGAVPGGRQGVEVRDPSRKLRWWEIVEKAFLQLTSTEEGRARYGDPQKGATLEQSWRTQFALSGVFQVCLLASGKPPVSTADIPRTVQLAPLQLVDALSRALALHSRVAAQTFVYDGRMGHSIVLLGHDPSASLFTYHDPWPGRSLLCRENNAAGVAAEPGEEGGWRITKSELSKVVFAAFLWPTVWADLRGVTYRITYSQLRNSEFWSFFHLHEVGRRETSQDRTAVLLETGGFHEEIEFQVQQDASECIREGSLALRRAWVVRKPWDINPFALDITRGFLGALTPTPDRDDIEPLMEGLWILKDPQRVSTMLEREAGASSVLGRVLLTYLGMQSESITFMTFSRLVAKNVEKEGEPWLHLRVELL